MKVFESSEYVKARTKLLAEYFSSRGWVLSTGSNNTVLIYISSKNPFTYTQDQLAAIIAETDYHIEPTGLKMSEITYRFYHQGTLVEEISFMPGSEFDRFTS